MFNIEALLQKAVGKNNKMLPMMYEAYKVAKEIQHSREALLKYINDNNAKIRDMLPYLQQGSTVRSILDKTFPGMAPKIEAFGKELMREQETGQNQQQTGSAAPDKKSTLGNRFPALKPR